MKCLLVFLLVLIMFSWTIHGDDSNTNENKPPASMKKRNWSDKEIQNIEKQWEADDEAYELEQEIEHNRKIAASKNPIDFSDTESILKAAKDRFAMAAGSGTKMLFIALKSTQLNGMQALRCICSYI